MKRTDRQEYNHIRKTIRQVGAGYGTTVTIKTAESRELKQALHDLYTEMGFHPASITTDRTWYDGCERIIYIYGLTFDLHGEQHPWTELYSREEKAAFERALG